MQTPYVTNRIIALAIELGPLRKLAFRGYNYVAKRLNRSFTAKTYFGADILCNPKDYVQRMIFSFGFWEPNISAYIQGVLQPGDVFVDVGANVGYHSLLAAKLVGSKGTVVAIEAAPTTFTLLKNNLALNRCENALAINVAASDRHGQVDLFSDETLAETTTIASRGFAFSAQIACAPLSDIIPSPLAERVRLLKLDIEGGEIPVMNNLLSNLDRFSPELQVIAEVSVSELKAEWKDIIDKMRANGFSTYSITNEYDDDSYLNWRTPSAPAPLSELPATQFDILFRHESHRPRRDDVLHRTIAPR
jgi:FkbM family methyltransferase